MKNLWDKLFIKLTFVDNLQSRRYCDEDRYEKNSKMTLRKHLCICVFAIIILLKRCNNQLTVFESKIIFSRSSFVEIFHYL
jgi:hypothetical protein